MYTYTRNIGMWPQQIISLRQLRPVPFSVVRTRGRHDARQSMMMMRLVFCSHHVGKFNWGGVAMYSPAEPKKYAKWHTDDVAFLAGSNGVNKKSLGLWSFLLLCTVELDDDNDFYVAEKRVR